MFSCVTGADGFNLRLNSLKEGGHDEDQLKSMDLETQHGFDGLITRTRDKKMVNEAQLKMENMKPKLKLVKCLKNKENELT